MLGPLICKTCFFKKNTYELVNPYPFYKRAKRKNVQLLNVPTILLDAYSNVQCLFISPCTFFLKAQVLHKPTIIPKPTLLSHFMSFKFVLQLLLILLFPTFEAYLEAMIWSPYTTLKIRLILTGILFLWIALLCGPIDY